MEAEDSPKSTNLTGGQIQTVMDTLLYGALRELATRTSVFDVQVGYLLSLATVNKKRRLFSGVDRAEAITCLVQTLQTDDPEIKMALISKVQMERHFVYMFLKNFVTAYYDQFMVMYRRFMITPNAAEHKLLRGKLNTLVQSSGAESISGLYLALSNVNTYLTMFFSYYKDVVSDFVRLCSQQAKFYVSTNTNHYDIDDVKQNFLRAVIIAINKYDSGSGALTSYVKWWLLNAQTCSSAEHEYGIAYIIPQAQRKKLVENGASPHSVNFSVSLDTYGGDEDDGETSLLQRIDDNRVLDDVVSASRTCNRLSLLVKAVDPYGVARLSFDLPEAFSEAELRQMHLHMRQHRLI